MAAAAGEATGADIAAGLHAVDALTVDVLSDNVSDSYVSKTLFAVSEFANVVRGGAAAISGETLLVANLGYGLRLTLRHGATERVMLFDAGTEGTAFLRNCRNLALDLATVEAIAVTHGHWDHMGALPAAIGAIAGVGGRVEVHVNPGMFDERAVVLAGGAIVPVGKVPTPEEMERLGATVVNRPEARLLFDGLAFLSGEIPRVSAFETGRADHLCRTGPNEPWRPDPYLMDERMLVVRVAGLGLVVFSACSHAGIVNVLTEVRRLFPDEPIHAVMGGLHLGGVMERIIPDTVAALAAFEVEHIICGHCTGWRALHALADAYGAAVSQSSVGTTYTFAAAAPSESAAAPAAAA